MREHYSIPLATSSGFLCPCDAFSWKRIANLSSMPRIQRFAPRAHRRFDVLGWFRCFMLTLTHFIEVWHLRGRRSRLRRKRFDLPGVAVAGLAIAALPYETRAAGCW